MFFSYNHRCKHGYRHMKNYCENNVCETMGCEHLGSSLLNNEEKTKYQLSSDATCVLMGFYSFIIEYYKKINTHIYPIVIRMELTETMKWLSQLKIASLPNALFVMNPENPSAYYIQDTNVKNHINQIFQLDEFKEEIKIMKQFPCFERLLEEYNDIICMYQYGHRTIERLCVIEPPTLKQSIIEFMDLSSLFHELELYCFEI